MTKTRGAVASIQKKLNCAKAFFTRSLAVNAYRGSAPFALQLHRLDSITEDGAPGDMRAGTRIGYL